MPEATIAKKEAKKPKPLPTPKRFLSAHRNIAGRRARSRKPDPRVRVVLWHGCVSV
jgi:hypothetical protein